MGDPGIARLGGLKDWSMDVTFIQDFAATKVDSIIYPLLGVPTVYAVRATTSARGTSNPDYTGTGMIFEYTPLDGSVGDLATATITISGSNGVALARSTSSS